MHMPQSMRKLVSIVYTTIFLLVLSSCATEPIEQTIESTWKLTSWSVNIQADLNSDNKFNTNLLQEIDCINNETLVFDKQGIVTSNATFNPEITIALLNDTTNDYVFDVVCDTDGVIGFASSYSISGNLVKIDDEIATINENQLIRIFDSAIKIYSEDLTQVIETRDLTLVYTKI
jgi:hypothetical protein